MDNIALEYILYMPFFLTRNIYKKNKLKTIPAKPSSEKILKKAELASSLFKLYNGV